MTAGRSAGADAHRSSDGASVDVRAGRPSLATLDRLTSVGYVVLAGRRTLGRRSSAVDLLVVGPGGLFLVDAMPLDEPAVTQGRLLDGPRDVTEDIYGLADLGQIVEADLARIGVSPNEVHPVVVVPAGRPLDETVDSVRILDAETVASVIASHGQRWSPDLVGQVVARCGELFAEDPVRVTPGEHTEPALLMPAGEAVAPDEQELDALDELLVESMLGTPAEEWVALLHPDHAALVRRSFPGPARVHGDAGTGKSTLGLHRAAYLARLDTRGRVLVTTLNDVLPAVLEGRFAAIAPDAVDRVDFLTVHDVVARVLAARGREVPVDASQAITAFNRSWNRVGRDGVLSASGLPVTYWQEEVGVVVRGRGLTDLDAYVTLDRVGRSYPVSDDERRAVWDLALAYDDELDRQGITDWAGLVLRAEAALVAQPYGTVDGEEAVTAVIVDEAQDLSCSQARLLHSLVGDRPDGLLLIDDGEQSIYPGGYSLEEAGIVVDDRSVRLHQAFRAQGHEGAGVQTARWHGSAADVSAALVDRVQQVVAHIGTNYEDVVVLSPTLAGARVATAALTDAGIPVRHLAGPARRSVAHGDAVTVGTIKAARGLEFKHVLVCGAPPATVHLAPDQVLASAAAEIHERRRRELDVASARARDGLWIATTPAT